MTSTGERRKRLKENIHFHRYHLGKGIVEDLKQRVPYYLSDFFDGFVGEKTLQVEMMSQCKQNVLLDVVVDPYKGRDQQKIKVLIRALPESGGEVYPCPNFLVLFSTK